MFKKELTQEEKERLLIEKVIETLEMMPVDAFWAYSPKIKYCIGMLEGFVSVKYKK
jgi:hypothetical protein